MKKVVLLLAGLLTVLSMGFASAQFSDVPAGHWAKEAVEALAAEGIILGFPDGTFRGNENLTRYQAAMIIYRLLQKLEPGQMASLDPETITALRNAVQELAAELASLGVRVSALEDNAATKSDVARLEKMIAELQGAAPAGAGDAAAIKDLADRVEAAAIAADAALAQVQELSAKVDTIGAQASANADSIKALNELAVMLNQDVLSLQDRVTALEKAMASGGIGVELPDFATFATKDDVQSVRDYVTAIRGDLVTVSNRVSALEAQVSDLQEQVNGLALYQFTVSGSLSAEYSVYRVLDGGLDDFDTDRLFETAFSTGEATADAGDIAAKADLGASFVHEGQWSSELTLSVTFPNAYEIGEAGISIQGVEIDASADVSGGSYSTNFGWSISGVRTSFTVGNDPLIITLAREPHAHFTEYVFDNDYYSRGTGYVVEYKGILDITGVYGSTGDTDVTNGDNRYYRGVMAGKSFDAFSIAAYVVQEEADVYGPVYSNLVYGAHAEGQLGPVSFEGEYDMSDNGTAASVAYVKGGLDLADGKFKLSANYRAIDPAFSGISEDVDQAGYQSEDADGNVINGAPFGSDEKGFGADLSAELGIFTIAAYFDQYTDFAGTAGSQVTKYGGSLKLATDFFRVKGFYDSYDADETDASNNEVAFGGCLGLGSKGFDLKAFYNQATVGGIMVEGPTANLEAETKYGVALSYDGSVEEALISGLNFFAGYTVYPAAGGLDSAIEVYGDYDAKFGIVGIHPLFRYYAPQPGDATIKYGAQASIGEIGMIFKPTIFGDYVARTTGATSEMKYSVGLELADFVFGSSLKGGYANYTGNNVASVTLADAELVDPFNPADNRVWSSEGAVNGGVSGYFFEWTYEGMTFAYIDAVVNNGGATTHGQAFKVSYSVEF